MPLMLAVEQDIAARRRIWQTLSVRTDEVIAFCPNCKTVETLFLEDFNLMPTQKFSQRGNQIYHSCGSDRPCCLYHGI